MTDIKHTSNEDLPSSALPITPIDVNSNAQTSLENKLTLELQQRIRDNEDLLAASRRPSNNLVDTSHHLSPLPSTDQPQVTKVYHQVRNH